MLAQQGAAPPDPLFLRGVACLLVTLNILLLLMNC